jgi:hypothetical protein
MESFRLVLNPQEELPLPGASWADRDQAGRLVFARGGSILVGDAEGGRLIETELIDLSANVPTPVETPEYVQRW